MSIWTRIAEALAALKQGEALATVFDRLRGAPAPECSVGFTIAVIALGAKMAKADGQVTRDEVAAFRRVFAIPPGEETNAARVFNLARQDVAGFDAYARQIAGMFANRPPAARKALLIDLIEGLFHIALADDVLHEAEEAFLSHVAEVFGLDQGCYRAIRARLVEPDRRDPHEVLGVAPDATPEAIRAAWRQLVKDNHPDALAARGLPAEAQSLAEARLIVINQAWEALKPRHAA